MPAEMGSLGLMRDQTGRISVLRRSSELIRFLSEVNTIIAEASKVSCSNRWNSSLSYY